MKFYKIDFEPDLPPAMFYEKIMNELCVTLDAYF